VGDRGQATVEWLGLLLLAALLLGSLVTALSVLNVGLSLPGAILERLTCAVRLSEDCGSGGKLADSYGDDTSAALRAHAPALLYEPGMSALPVDYRRCREDACAAGPGEGAVSRSDAGEPVTAFTHVIDCRPAAAAETESRGADCYGERAGNLYLQYWFYYPGSATAEGSTPLKPLIRKGSTAVGKPTYHPDDWESFQIRVAPDGSRSARASSHHWYSYELGGGGLIPGHRLIRRPAGGVALKPQPEVVNGWGPDVGTLHVSGGSHAGNARVNRTLARTTKDHRIRLIPLSRIAANDRTTFAVTPPWRKRVFFDPEYAGTD
jgi:hypothetical protein